MTLDLPSPQKDDNAMLLAHTAWYASVAVMLFRGEAR